MPQQDCADDLLALPVHELAASLAPAAAANHYDELRGRPACAPTKLQTGTLQTSAKPHELQAASGQATAGSPLNPAWRDFFSHLGQAGLAELNHKRQLQQRQIRNNGITYNVYADQAQASSRPWSLELFPLLITPQSWAEIETGIHQRAQLLNLIMTDAYGQQHLTRSGLLPSALVQGHPDYLHALQGVLPPGGNWLQVLAFDLARQPDGQWAVVSQRTQAPSGLGYLMENRLITNSLFPDAFRHMQVQRLAGSYRALLDNLRRLSGAGAQAHIALLTPGPYNETYFEQAYLARYLGLPLVEGNDLTVRNDQLYLKTLHGLKPLHGLIKRVDDNFLDPLELRADSTLGVPGLLQAVRAGKLVMANMPGSGFLESSALLGFLPALADHFLGQPLSLPALGTWWCGERAVLDGALQHLGQRAIKATYPEPAGSSPTLLGRDLSGHQLDELATRIMAHGENYTVQEYVPLSQMPSWEHDRMVTRSLMLRVFALADGLHPDGSPRWRVMPGGMVRLAPHGTEVASMQQGGSSADAWVITADPIDPTSLLHSPPLSSSHDKQRRLVTSRAAENLFWLGRYTERVENTTRLAQLTLRQLNSDETLTPALGSWLLTMCIEHALVPPDATAAAASPLDFQHALIAGLNNRQQLTSIGHNLRALKQAGFAVRERLAQDYWNLIVRTEDSFARKAKLCTRPHDDAIDQTLELLAELSQSVAAMTGGQLDRMVRDDGWRLLSIGRQIERLSFHAQALDCALGLGALDDSAGFNAMLALFDCIITFNGRYQHRHDLAALLDLLVLDSENPRSLGWVAQTLHSRIIRLAQGGKDEQTTFGDQLAGLLPAPALWPLDLLCKRDHEGRYPILQSHLQACMQATWTLSERIAATFFTHSDQLRRSVGL